METPADRLKAARLSRGYRTAKAAAEAMDEKISTYSQHEMPNRSIPERKAKLYADFFHTTPEWILYGISPSQVTQSRNVFLIGNLEDKVLDSQKYQIVQAPPRLNEDTHAVQIISDEPLGKAFLRALVYFSKIHSPPHPSLFNELCVVCLDTDILTLGALLPSGVCDQFHVVKPKGDPLLNARPKWAARVHLISL